MNQRTVPPGEYTAVTGVAARYVEALRIGSVGLLDAVFHENSVTYGTVNGDLVGGSSGNPAADFIRDHGQSPAIESHIDVLDMTPTTAAVRIILENDAVGSACTENLLLIKQDGVWTVVAKVFHQFGN